MVTDEYGSHQRQLLNPKRCGVFGQLRRQGGGLLAVESCDLSQADKSIIRLTSFPKLSDG